MHENSPTSICTFSKKGKGGVRRGGESGTEGKRRGGKGKGVNEEGERKEGRGKEIEYFGHPLPRCQISKYATAHDQLDASLMNAD